MSILRLSRCFAVFLIPFFLVSATFADWPPYRAKYLRIEKAPLTMAPWNMEPIDKDWAHLHRGHHVALDSDRVSFIIKITTDQWDSILPVEQSNLEVRYTVHGVPVSDWLAPGAGGESGFFFTLLIDNPALAAIPNGFHDVSVEIRQQSPNGPSVNEYKPYRIFLHLVRGETPVSSLVPILTNHHSYKQNQDFGPQVVYVDTNNLSQTGYPANPNISPWSGLPYQSDLYLESLAPTGEYMTGAQMRWWDPPHPGQVFIRALNPNQGQSASGSSGPVGAGGGGHSRLPFKDGPRGVGWMSPYISGQVDLSGRYFFAEDGAGLRVLLPNGHIKTIAGRRVKPGFEPVWIQKPLDLIFDNTHIVGQWQNGFHGFHEGQKDVAFDPQNPNTIYMVSQFDHCIWKIEVQDIDAGLASVSVFAGDVNHTAGYLDGQGHSARFNEPYSLVFDPVSRLLYVADKNNDSIRVVNPNTREVGTLFGSPGMVSRLRSRGVTNIYNRGQNRAAMKVEVTASEAASNIRPEIYRPQTVRVTSDGKIILLSIGDGAIRKISPSTGETKLLEIVDQHFDEWLDGWAWLDVARYGTAGPRDGIYWLKSTGEGLDGGRHFNEIFGWLPSTGGPSKALVNDSWDPYPVGWGARTGTGLPHYPWGVAVDPRGALLFTGFGDHGIVRLRLREQGDPIASSYYMVGHHEWQTVWRQGNGEGLSGVPSIQGFPFALAFGWNAHNYVGTRDGWGLRGNEDCNARATYFGAPADILSNPTLRDYFCKYTELISGPQRDKNLAVPTPTIAPSATPPLTPTRSTTATPTAIATNTRVPAATPSLTATPSSTPTMTPTRTATNSPSPVATSTAVPSPTIIIVPSPTASPKPLPTISRTPTAKPTVTPTKVPRTPTASPTPRKKRWWHFWSIRQQEERTSAQIFYRPVPMSA